MIMVFNIINIIIVRRQWLKNKLFQGLFLWYSKLVVFKNPSWISDVMCMLLLMIDVFDAYFEGFFLSLPPFRLVLFYCCRRLIQFFYKKIMLQFFLDFFGILFWWMILTPEKWINSINEILHYQEMMIFGHPIIFSNSHCHWNCSNLKCEKKWKFL